jgi:mannitol-specific phosphotransferase system IIBC component
MAEVQATMFKKLFNGNPEMMARIITLFISLLVSGTVAWMLLQGRVSKNCDGIIMNQRSIQRMDDRLRESEQFMYEQRIHNQWTKEALIEIKEAVK